MKVISLDDIHPSLTSADLDKLELCIFDAIISISDPSLRPQFTKYEKKASILVFTIANKMSEDWFHAHAGEIGESCKVPFRVVNADQTPRINVVEGSFHPPRKLKRVEDNLKYIEIQNPNLPATTWKIIYLDDYYYGTTNLTLSLDNASADELKKTGGIIYYGLGTTNLTFIEE